MYGYVDVSGSFRIRMLYTAFSEEIGTDYFFAGERHDFWELVVVDRGEIGVTAGEEAGILRQGQAILHRPMEFHRIWSAGGEPARIIVFSFGAEGLPADAAGQFVLREPGCPGVLLEELRQAFRQDGISIVGIREPSISAQLFLKRLELFVLELVYGRNGKDSPRRSRSAENYAQIIRFMEQNVHRDLSVEEIARQCSMSSINAKQTFSRYAGMGIRAYFNKLKIQSAITMLQKGCSVQETAAALGFSSPNYFCTVFKRITGKTPTAYK